MRIYQIDAFTDRPFAGNPAGVCLLPAAAGDAWMQSVAREMNLSETAFLAPEGDGWRLRWFTPAVEVDLCGHATLASAHILWEQGLLAPDAVARFRTKSGLLTAGRDGNRIELNFPAKPPEGAAAPAGLLEALGVEAVYVGRNIFDYLVEVADEAAVRNAAPDFHALAKLPARGVILTAHGQGEYDFVSRFFAPAVGVNEDPVTGSAHCCLGPYWREKLGRDTFLAYQASPRGGVLRVKIDSDGRILLSGQAVTVLAGELTVPLC